MNAETKEQRKAKREADTETQRHRGQHLHAQRRQQETAEERIRRLDYHRKYYQHGFDFELVQDRDRRVALARYNLSERFKHNETEEQRLHGLEELRRNTSLMTQKETDDKQVENLKEQLDVLLCLAQEFDHYHIQYFKQYFSKH